jgi:hypothetical protein
MQNKKRVLNINKLKNTNWLDNKLRNTKSNRLRITEKRATIENIAKISGLYVAKLKFVERVALINFCKYNLTTLIKPFSDSNLPIT